MSDTALHGIPNYRVVHAQLATGGQPSEAQLAEAARMGFEVVINLALHDQPRYSLPDEPGLVQTLGMAYIWIPVPFDAPTESHLLDFFAAMRRHQDKKILLHCAANMRVSAFYGLYLAIEQHQPLDQAFELMQDIWEPDDIWNAFIESMLEKLAPTGE